MPKTTAARLLSPMSLGPLNLPNRIVMAPLTRGRAGADRIPNRMMADYYRQRSTAGLIISEATTISPQANGWVNSPGIYTDAMIEGWQTVTNAVHESGGRMYLQLWHCGRASHSDFHGGKPAVAPSAVKLQGDKIHTPEGKKDYETPKSLSLDEIAATIDDYRTAASNAKTAGFDGVEVHMQMVICWTRSCSQKQISEPISTVAASKTAVACFRRSLLR